MLISTTLSFIILIVSGVLLETILRRRRKTANQNPQFLVFQKTFLATEIVILLADWLQAPYNYKVSLRSDNSSGYNDFSCIRCMGICRSRLSSYLCWGMLYPFC